MKRRSAYGRNAERRRLSCCPDGQTSLPSNKRRFSRGIGLPISCTSTVDGARTVRRVKWGSLIWATWSSNRPRLLARRSHPHRLHHAGEAGEIERLLSVGHSIVRIWVYLDDQAICSRSQC